MDKMEVKLLADMVNALNEECNNLRDKIADLESRNDILERRCDWMLKKMAGTSNDDCFGDGK